MCWFCKTGQDRDGSLAHRAHVLQLLALLEHPDALPADAALRLGREILALSRSEPTLLRCDPVAPSGPEREPVR
jgi:hypothetical protein